MLYMTETENVIIIYDKMWWCDLKEIETNPLILFKIIKVCIYGP